MRSSIPVALACSFLLGACGRRPAPSSPESSSGGAGKLRVIVSILPQAYFVERVGGDRVSVEVLVGPGQSPATYEPSPRQMAALGEADVYFRIGVPFENALLDKIRASRPGLNVVDTRQGITLRPMESHPHGDREGNGGEGAPEGAPDPHIWLDPKLAEVQARTIRHELVRLDPQNRPTYDGNLNAFEADLGRVDSEIRSVLAPLEGRRIFVFHPAFGYFAEAYGLDQVAIEAEGKEPGPRELADIIRRAKDQGVKAVFVQQQFSDAQARAIAEEIGATVVPLDPLAKDYLRNLEDMATKVAEALRAAEA